ncbi:hypothetical protein [Bradyrhizobium sp. AUGA SZCCT0283]|uniref:hypothetical protein n=1 Tax=Bradyrhizobium sp. AUGA SZCCT0283 TaxID=2807671 RepID=UPI001BAA6524|nr:hypothetical protein [Bradyrhizobium sp. AUGA SZCCT0283]MBR1279274.1 hypothetical protein [Bradyrhizobium sp. AUGA SZCCT0283]
MAAAGLLVAAIAASILISTLRPVTLRIAVGSASENARIVEAIARVLTRERSPVRLSVVQVDDGRTEQPLNSGSADLAAVRSDVMSAGVLAIATLRSLFQKTRQAALDHERSKVELKALVPEDAKEASGHGIRAKRSKSGAISFDIVREEPGHAAVQQ